MDFRGVGGEVTAADIEADADVGDTDERCTSRRCEGGSCGEMRLKGAGYYLGDRFGRRSSLG